MQLLEISRYFLAGVNVFVCMRACGCVCVCVCGCMGGCVRMGVGVGEHVCLKAISTMRGCKQMLAHVCVCTRGWVCERVCVGARQHEVEEDEEIC